MCACLDHLNAVCSTLSSSSVHSRQLASQSDGGDLRSNTVIFGVNEDRDASVWRRSVENALYFVVNHAIDTVDIYRLGCFVNNDTQRKHRPILVKLRAA
jgi:hypothetical protein